ncbi:acyl-CoA thioesterase [Membranihabitans maritimus]|uniref:acyl-CoA thioesterase n=1 Tax=Membranihabitans maritimus TaxID=2904244 RepID=UPI001F33FF5B|nr:acyl-CoA thioesterase II [Membranihabitans maritimus]
MSGKELIKTLKLEKVGERAFCGRNFDIGTKAIFGGHVLAQSIIAAYKTVPEGRFIHSLHSYFILPGDPSEDIIYRLDDIRDGGSFSTRRVLAEQKGKTIFIMAASFQKEEKGYDHQSTMPGVPRPDTLKSFDELKKNLLGLLPKPAKRLLEVEFPFEFKPVDLSNPMLPGKHDPERKIWIRFREGNDIDRETCEALLAYVSDYNLLATAILPHERATFSNTIIATIDHAMWFHRPFDIGDWILYDVLSPNAISARGFATGQLFDRNGKLVGSIAQEGLIRPVT